MVNTIYINQSTFGIVLDGIIWNHGGNIVKVLYKTNLIMSAIPNIRPLLEVSDPESNKIRLNY